MKKLLALVCASAAVLTAPMIASAGDRSADRNDRVYTIVWRDVQAGRGPTQLVPLRVQVMDADRHAPYALTGERHDSDMRREYRDVPTSHGQTIRIPIWVNE